MQTRCRGGGWDGEGDWLEGRELYWEDGWRVDDTAALRGGTCRGNGRGSHMGREVRGMGAALGPGAQGCGCRAKGEVQGGEGGERTAAYASIEWEGIVGVYPCTLHKDDSYELAVR